MGKPTRPVMLSPDWFNLKPALWQLQHHLSCTKLVIGCFFCSGDSTSKVTSADVSVSNHQRFKSDLSWRMSPMFLSVMCHPECNAAIHKKCLEKIIGRCTGTATNSRDTMVSKVLQCQHYNLPKVSLLKIFTTDLTSQLNLLCK